MYWDVNSPIERNPNDVDWLGVYEGIGPYHDLWVCQEYSCTRDQIYIPMELHIHLEM